MMNEVFNFLKSLSFHDNDTVVVAVSGGPDSMSLLHLLLQLREQVKIHIVCAHVHHNVRVESDQEKEFVESYCKEHQILFEYFKIKNYSHNNFHQEARTIRYQFFEQVVNKYHATYLMTAHHGDDLIETILMRLVRGSSLYGYHGFSRVTELLDYTLVRPLITVTREEIMKYIDQYQIPYVTDMSNYKDDYTRNRYRKYIVPKLKEENPQVHRKFLNFSTTLLECSHYVKKLVQNKEGTVFQECRLFLDLWKREDSFMQEQIIQFLLERVYEGRLNQICGQHVYNIKKFLLEGKNNSHITLPDHVFLVKEYNRAYFIDTMSSIQEYQFELQDQLRLPNGYVIEKVEETEKDDNDTCRLDINEIVLPLYVRTRKSGDRMDVKGLSGTKKINDIFTDEKIEKPIRDTWPIVVDATGKILWLPGLKKTKFDRTKNGKYDIILRYSLKKEGLDE